MVFLEHLVERMDYFTALLVLSGQRAMLEEGSAT